MKYVSVAEMISIEQESDAKGHTYSRMMEQAGKGLAEVVRDAYSHIVEKKVLGLVGSGNNGGDTLVAFCYLLEWGWQATAYIVRPRLTQDPLIGRYISAGGRFLEYEKDTLYQNLILEIENSSLLVDGVLGTGIRLPLRGSVVEVLDLVGKCLRKIDRDYPVIAVDCPSGIDCDTGEAASMCLPADITVTMAAVKQGLLRFPAYKFVGDLRLVSIGLPKSLETYNAICREVIDKGWVQYVLPERALDSHKGTFGTVLILGGTLNFCGAVLLAGKAAFRSGSGWVTLGIPASIHNALAGHFIEATWLLLPDSDGCIAVEAVEIVQSNLGKPTALLIGPGFGLRETSREFIAQLLQYDRLPSLVFDADGLKLLAQLPAWWKLIPGTAVLTPHPGEMSNLTGLSKDMIQSNRIEIAEKYAKEWGHVVVLKGAFTVIAAPDGRTSIIPVATPALARAGTGDVLAGLIAGLKAQGMEAFEAGTAGAWIHAQAGLRAADVLGGTAAVLAGDVLAATVKVLAEI